jgi:hypothetical protein
MAKTRRSDLPPPARNGAEVVVKQAWEYSSRFRMWFAPSLFICGTRAGFAWLSEYFAWLAGSIRENSAFDDDAHVHLEHDAPLNEKLSDTIGLKLICMPLRHRRRILGSLGIHQKSKLSGSPVVQWTRILNHLVARSAEILNARERTRLCKEIRHLIDEAESCIAALQETPAEVQGGRRETSPRPKRDSKNQGLFGFSLAPRE